MPPAGPRRATLDAPTLAPSLVRRRSSPGSRGDGAPRLLVALRARCLLQRERRRPPPRALLGDAIVVESLPLGGLAFRPVVGGIDRRALGRCAPRVHDDDPAAGFRLGLHL
eukprot:1637770-Prymnesium_polylepis.1